MAPWFRFFRLRLAGTAVSNVLVGAVLSVDSWRDLPVGACGLLVGSTLLAYMFGMGLNDLRDWERDALNAPHRPLPAGEISQKAARVALTLLFIGSLLLSLPLGICAVAVWVAMFVCILLYNVLLKDLRIIGPVAMGGVRFFLVLYGATAMAPAASLDFFPVPSFGASVAAVVVFAYVASLTQFSLSEETAEPHQLRLRGRELFWAVVVVLMILGLLAGRAGENHLEVGISIGAMMLWVGAYSLRPLRQDAPLAILVTLRLLVGLLLLDTVILVSYDHVIPAAVSGSLGLFTWRIAPTGMPRGGGSAS